MSSVGKVIITIVIVVVLALGAWWIVSSMSSSTDSRESTGGQTEESNDSEASNDTADNQEAAVTITYDGTGFTPASTTAKVGDVIRITNNSENALYFASDEHPTHLDNSELNVGDIEPGSSATFTISSAGTWGYHDHYNASASGEIVVE